MPRKSLPAGDDEKNRPGDWFADALKEIAKAMGKRLNETDQNKPVNKLTFYELQGMAYDAICQYTDMREAERIRQGKSLFEDDRAMAIVPELSNPNGYCVMCGMQARGFVVQFNPNVHLKPVKTANDVRLKQGPFPQYACCGLLCSEVALKLVTMGKGIMPANTITQMEQQAIRDAKTQVFEALTEIGAVEAFNDQPAQNMEYLIYKIWTGLRASMKRQSDAGEIPF